MTAMAAGNTQLATLWFSSETFTNNTNVKKRDKTSQGKKVA